MVVDGYVRVSQVRGRAGARFMSPALQREQILGWAARNGAHVGELYEELDQSGGRRDRPLLERAVQRVERGDSQGIVVATTDRFGRSVVHGLLTIERIRAAGGTFVAVCEGFDLDTDAGRMALRQMLNMAEWHLDRVRASWDAARERAIARGVHLGSKAPTGYQRRRDGRLRVDPIAGPAIGELFARRAEGMPISAAARLLEQRGVRTPYGNAHWCYTSTRGLLRNRVYLGEVRSGEFVKTQAHPPLTDAATWQLAQSPVDVTESRAALPAGVANVRYAGCRMTMNASTTHAKDGRAIRHYVCRRRFSAGPCPAPASITSSLLEPYLEDVFFELLDRRPRPGRAALRAAERSAANAEAALVAYRDNDRALAALGPERFAAGLEKRQEKLSRALRALGLARLRTTEPQLPPRLELEASWPRLSAAERRDTLRHVIDCVFIRRGRDPVHERVIVCRRGEAPDDLPRRGDKHAPVRALDPEWQPASTAGATTEPRVWSQQRIHHQLEAFTHGRTHWPHFEAFHRAGRGRLYRQVEATGGCRLWAQRLGLLHSTGITSRRRWTDDRIRTTLTAYLADKTHFPSRRQFTADGFAAVRWAVNQHGGVDHWATEFGLPRANRQQGKHRYWTVQRIHTELTAFIDQHGPQPTRQTFREHGAGPLLRAMQRAGGRAAWVSRISTLDDPGAHWPSNDS